MTKLIKTTSNNEKLMNLLLNKTKSGQFVSTKQQTLFLTCIKKKLSPISRALVITIIKQLNLFFFLIQYIFMIGGSSPTELLEVFHVRADEERHLGKL